MTNNNYQISKWNNLWNKITYKWDLNKINSEFYLVPDFSHWEAGIGFNEDLFAQFIKDFKVKALIYKICDASSTANLFYDDSAEFWNKLAIKYKLLNGGYAWIQPSVDPTTMYKFYYNWIKDHQIELPDIADFEEKKNFTSASDMLWRLKTFLANSKYGTDAWIYTGKGYISDLRYGMGTAEAELKMGWMRNYKRWWPFYSRFYPNSSWPWNEEDWIGWQYSDQADFPYYKDEDNINGKTWGFPSYGLDMNWFKQSYLQPYLDKMGVLSPTDPNNGTIPPIPDEPPIINPPVVKTLKYAVSVPSMNIRSGPGTNYNIIGTKKQGDIVEVINVGGSNSWIQIESGKWICNNLNGVQYLTKEI